MNWAQARRLWWLWLLVLFIGLPVGCSGLLTVAEAIIEATDDHWENGLEYGMAAAVAAQDADSPEEWDAVSQYWTSAIVELRQAEEAEAGQKIEEYEQNRAAAQARARALRAPEVEARQATERAERSQAIEALKAYDAAVRSMDPEGNLFVDVRGYDDELKTVVVEVSAGWHYQPEAARLQAATNLWRGWVAARDLEQADFARLRIEDSTGRKVGGSRALAGSLIYVDD